MFLNFQINNEQSVTDYKSTSVVSLSFNKSINYKKLEETDENN